MPTPSLSLTRGHQRLGNTKKGFSRSSFLVTAKPICIHYNKKWKASSEKFERAHPRAYQLPLNFILFKGTFVCARARVFPLPQSILLSDRTLPFQHPPRRAFALQHVAGKVGLTFFFQCGKS